VDDPSYKFDLWDYAQNPLGVFEDDSVSTMELWAASSAASSMRDLVVRAGERQTLAGRASSVPIELWHRTENSRTAYGFVGRVSSLRQDTEAGLDTERRRVVSAPSIMPVMNGPMPWIGGGRLHYAVRLRFGGEDVEDRYRFYVDNAAGQFLDQNGDFAGDPPLFTPSDYKVVTQGAGVGLGYDLAKQWRLALMTDVVRHRFEGYNDRPRSKAEIREKRPYGVGQATLIGRSGDLEMAVDARGWRATSEQSWRFTLSAGTGGNPVAGRGKLLEREEEGSSLDGRVRWRRGAFTLGATAGTRYSQVEVIPPDASDTTSFNAFLNRLYYRIGADTLSLPDSIRANTAGQYGVVFGGGAGWTFKRGAAGVEYHWVREITNQSLVGEGPKRIAWDVRAGFEYRCNPVLTGRLGYVYRSSDDDDFTLSNEWIGHTGTLGFGLHPPGTTWTMEAGYALQFEQADFGDPGQPHANRQNLALQIRWLF
jgi:opacity protein-like surface antigen